MRNGLLVHTADIRLLFSSKIGVEFVSLVSFVALVALVAGITCNWSGMTA